MQLRRIDPPQPSSAQSSFQIGTYDEGLTDLADKVTVDKKQTFASREAAEAFAKRNPGAELVVETRNAKGALGYDVYSVTIHDKGQSLSSAEKMENLSLFDKPLAHIEKKSGKTTNRAFFVTADGKVGANIYHPKFDRTVYDRLRGGLGLDDSKHWFKLVDKYMTAPSPQDANPPIDSKELNHLKAALKPGDIIMSGNNGSFIHGIVYVGQDPELQAQLEKKWQLAPGSLNGEGMILHSLAADHGADVELNGQKFHQPAGGTGVIIDTIERYNARNPRDVMIAVEVKGTTEADRQAVIAEGKKMIGRGYDNGFNTFDDRDIYCTEFVYKAWMAAPDSDPGFTTQLHPLVPQTSGPISGWLHGRVNDNWKKEIEDDGYLYQEMIMTDGIITSPSIDIKWASQNADKSEFAKKHERWADGMDGKISKGYKELLQEHIPEQATRSRDLLGKIQQAA
ncbi:MAG: hypothetical protein CVV27_15625, partial [Candidatus Melainabacteria bacterium HGW-Melainabacteria-1]